MTMTTTATDVQIVPLTMSTAEVRIGAGPGPGSISIGRVGSANGRWFWQHRDGEQSSPIAANRSDAASALADYHRAFKLPVAATPVAAAAARPAGEPVRKLLFG